MTQRVTRPIALDRSFNTTGSNPQNIADTLANKLDAIKEAIENGGNVDAAFVCYYNATTAAQIYEAMESGKVPYFYNSGVVAQLRKAETNKYTFRATSTREVNGATYLDIVDYIVEGSVWSTETQTISGGGSGSQEAYLSKASSSSDFDTTGLSGMQTVLSVSDVPNDGIYQVSVMLSVTPKAASPTKSDLVFGFSGTAGTGMSNTTFHAVVDDSQPFAQQLSFSTTLNLKAGTNSLKLSCDELSTGYLVFVDDLTVAQIVNGVYHNGDDFEDVHTLPEIPDFNNDDGVLVDGATGGPRFMLWQTLANKVLGFIKSLSTTITAFRTGDVIPVDGPSGTAKMGKDDLLKIITDNSAPQFDPTRTQNDQYEVGEIVAYGDKIYRFKNTHYGDWNSSDVDVVDIAALLGNLVNVPFTNRTYKHIQPNVSNIVNGSSVLTWNTYDQYFHVAEIPVEPNTIYLITNCIMTGNTLARWAVVDADNVCLDFGLPGSLQPMTINCNDYPTGSKILLSNRYSNPLKVQKMLSYSLEGKLADLKKYVDDADNITIEMTATVDGTCSSNHDGGNCSVYIPVPIGSRVDVALPSAMWSCDNYTGTSYVFDIVVKNEDGTETIAHGRTKSSISDSIGKVRSVSGAGRWVRIFCRADVGVVVSFGVTITCTVKDLAKGADDYANSFYQEILDLKSSRILLETQDDLLAFDQRNHFGGFLQSGSAFSPYTRPNARYEVSRLLRIAKNPSQGCAVYGGICVIMNQSYDGWTAFVDVKHNKVLQQGRQLNVKAEITHNNSLFFGSEKHTDTDKFPVLYGSTLDSRLLGWRITEDINGFNLTKVQTITFTGFGNVFATSGGLDLFDIFLDGENFVLFGTKYGDSSKRHIAICPAKAFSDGDSTIDYSEVTDEFDVDFDRTTQGGFVKNGVIYVAYNYGIVAISLQAKSVLDNLDMSAIGVDFEPEQVFEFDGSLFMSVVTKPAFEDDGTSRYTELVVIRLFS